MLELTSMIALFLLACLPLAIFVFALLPEWLIARTLWAFFAASGVVFVLFTGMGRGWPL